MEVYNVCSLGGICHSAQLLKRNGLKKCSYPFDWIFSSISMIIDCLEDGFKKFLDKSMYTSNSESTCGHNVYGKSMFPHHNPLNSEKDYQYFVRCVDRFNTLLKSEKHKMFCMMFVNTECNMDAVRDRIIEFNDKFKKYATNYTLLFILNVSKKEERAHKITNHENIHFIELHTVSDSQGVEFIEEIDNKYLDEILNMEYVLRE